MRHIVACSGCKRQFNVGSRAPGSQFHCHCGELVTVAMPQSHNAAVIRCSACGGARDVGERSCSFCSASFTLHEQDLHTTCPGCLARISDQAKFCHHCATPIRVESTPGEDTAQNCPTCLDESVLRHRSLGDGEIPILECQRCAGIWMGPATFKALENNAATQGRLQSPTTPTLVGPTAVDKKHLSHTGPMYRKCPECQIVMNRQNYARMSGIIIDVCKSHGLWFDAMELEAILRWIEGGGLDKAASREAFRQKEEVRKLQMDKRAAQTAMTQAGFSHKASLNYRTTQELGLNIIEVAWRGLELLFKK